MNHQKWIRALKTLRFILKIVVFIIVIYLIGSMIFSYEIIDIGFSYDNLIFFFIIVGIYALPVIYFVSIVIKYLFSLSSAK